MIGANQVVTDTRMGGGEFEAAEVKMPGPWFQP